MRVEVNGTQLYIDVDGPELVVDRGALTKRPTIVALHGGPGFDQGYLRPGLGPLREVAQLLFVDLRGQGRSGRPPLETCTLEQMADDVASLCEQLGVERPIVFGNSAGGFVALHLALRHRDLVGGLILQGTSPTLAPMADDVPPPPSLGERAGPEALAIANRMFGGDFSEASMAAFAQAVAPYYAGPTHLDVPGPLMGLSPLTPEIATYFFGHLAASYDLRTRLPEIVAPTLVVVGSYDWVCPPVASRVLAAGIPGADLVEVEESGHFVFSEEPEQFQDAVRRFLDRVH